MRRGAVALALIGCAFAAGCGRTLIPAGGGDEGGTPEPSDGEIGIIVTRGFQVETRTRTCEGVGEMERELTALAELLGELGIAVDVHFEDEHGVQESDLVGHEVVIYHDGGWSNPGARTTLATLRAFAASGRGILFLGDDVAKHAERSFSAYGDDVLYELTSLRDFAGNGSFGDGARVVDPEHPVIAGPAGTGGPFAYARDIDLAQTSDRATTLMEIESSGWPAVWATEDDGRRTLVFMASVYTAASCPVSDPAGLANLHTLLQNGALWVLHETD